MCITVKGDFLSWQKSLASSVRILVDNFALLSLLQQVFAAQLKMLSSFAVRGDLMPRGNATVLVEVFQNGWTIGWLQ